MEIALKRCAAWIAAGDASAPLNLSYLRLDALPDLPMSLQKLDCSHNDLTALPELPRALEILDCSYNGLTTLAGLPPGLKYLVYSADNAVDLPAGAMCVEAV